VLVSCGPSPCEEVTRLPALFELGRWGIDGACRDYPTSWWFTIRRDEIARAKDICAGCPVRVECLEHALARPGLLGMWAATMPAERTVIRERAAVLAASLCQ